MPPAVDQLGCSHANKVIRQQATNVFGNCGPLGSRSKANHAAGALDRPIAGSRCLIGWTNETRRDRANGDGAGGVGQIKGRTGQ